MHRLVSSFPSLDALLGYLHPQAPVEGLILDRTVLIDIVKRALYDLHQHRQRLAGQPGSADAVAQCIYWDHVLGWLKSSYSTKVTIFAGPEGQ